MSKQHIVHGTDYVKVGLEKIFSFSEKRAGGITPGKKHSLRKKFDANEDCMALLPGNEELLMVADSHYGSLASKMCVDEIPQLLTHSDEPATRRLLRTHFQLDHLIRERKGNVGGQGSCSTTLLTAMVREGRVHWVSTGDSRLWLIRDGSLKDVVGLDENDYPLFVGDNVVHLFQMVPWLESNEITDVVTERDEVVEVMLRLSEIQNLVRRGRATGEQISGLIDEITSITRLDFPFPVDRIMESWHEIHLKLARYMPRTGSLTLEPGDLLLLATDGIDEEESDCSQEKVAEILSGTASLEKRAKKLLSACMGRAGGGDNIAFLLAEF